MANLLILGAQGFLGYNLTLHLLKKGHSVRIFDKNENKFRKIEGCDYVYGDFVNIEEYSYIFDNIDIVIHLISTTIPNNFRDKVLYDIETNLVPSVKLLNLCIDKKIKKIIFASSGGTIYGKSENLKIKESESKNPICAYGINKLAMENYLYMYNQIYGLEYSVLRISNPYGPYHLSKSQGVINVFMEKALNNETIEIWGDGSVSRDYIFIDDVVRAFSMVIKSDMKEKVFNISSGKSVSLNEILVILKSVIKKDINVIYTDSRNIDVPMNCLDNSLAEKYLGWTPQIQLKEGIQKTFDYMNL